MNKKLLTVFTSSYNHGKFLEEAIESVLEQTYGNFEYLLYDDGSTDNTWDIMQSYAKQDTRIVCKRMEKQSTKAPVLNDSIRNFRGDVWTWCPADDIWFPTLLEDKALFAKQYLDSVIYSRYEIINPEGKHIKLVHTPDYTPEKFNELVWEISPIGFTGIWIPRTVFDKTGLFPEHGYLSEDFYWMIKATIDGVVFRCIPKVLYCKRKHPGSVTAKNYKKVISDIPKIREELRQYKESKDDA